MKNISDNNLVTTLLETDKYNLTKLRQITFKNVCENFENIPIGELLLLGREMFREILSNDEVAANETIIFDRLKQWVNKSEADRAKCVPELLKTIKLEHIPAEFLRNEIDPFSEKYGCVKLVLDEYRKRSVDNSVKSLCRNTNFHQNVKSQMFFLHLSESPNGLILKKWKDCQWIQEKTITFREWFFENTPFVYLDGYIYVIHNSGNEVTSYNVNTLERAILPDMKSYRTECHLIVVGKQIYVFGGGSSEQECERFNAECCKWEPLAAAPKKIKSCGEPVELCGVVYFHWLHSFEWMSYDTITNNWSEKCGNVQFGSSFFKSKNILYAMDLRQIYYKYDTKSDTWTKLKSFENDAQIRWTIEYFGETYGLTEEKEFGIVNMTDRFAFKRLPVFQVFHNRWNLPFLANIKIERELKESSTNYIL